MYFNGIFLKMKLCKLVRFLLSRSIILPLEGTLKVHLRSLHQECWNLKDSISTISTIPLQASLRADKEGVETKLM